MGQELRQQGRAAAPPERATSPAAFSSRILPAQRRESESPTPAASKINFELVIGNANKIAYRIKRVFHSHSGPGIDPIPDQVAGR